MRALKHIAFFLFCIITLCSCSKKLLPPTVEAKESIRNYKYAYVTGTDPLVTGSGTMVSGIYLSSQSSANPKDIITGRLVKEGFVILPELKEELLEETIITDNVDAVSCHCFMFLQKLCCSFYLQKQIK